MLSELLFDLFHQLGPPHTIFIRWCVAVIAFIALSCWVLFVLCLNVLMYDYLVLVELLGCRGTLCGFIFWFNYASWCWIHALIICCLCHMYGMLSNDWVVSILGSCGSLLWYVSQDLIGLEGF